MSATASTSRAPASGSSDPPSLTSQDRLLNVSQLRRRVTHIQADVPILLRLPSGKLKQVTLQPGRSVGLGKFGSFKADDVIGQPFGFTYEINEDGSLGIVLNKTLAELEETDATNENIRDSNEAQTLTYMDITALKASGLDGRALIQKETESNKSFNQKSVYAQHKFVQRKEAKHLKLFIPLPPDVYTVMSHQFEKNPEKVRGMRPDALSQMLALASVRPGGRYLIMDGVGGAIAAAVLDRLGGDGRVLALNDADSPPPFDIVGLMNFDPQISEGVLSSLHWAATEEQWLPQALPLEEDDVESVQSGKYLSDREKQRLRKRKATYDELAQTRAELFAGEFDGLLIACQYEPFSIIKRLLPYLAGSSNIVVHSPYLQPLAEAQAQMKLMYDFINVSISEPWLRRYQVLPGRTHPEMMTSATGGYILHAIRVLEDAEEDATVGESKRRKLAK